MRRWVILGFLALGFLLPSSCGGDDGGVAGGDGGSGNSGTGGGAADGGILLDTGANECSPSQPCEVGVCVAGTCCASAAQACETTCCAGGEVCVFDQCVVPGKPC